MFSIRSLLGWWLLCTVLVTEKMASETFLSKANTKFALDLFKKLSEEDNVGNIFYSPFSISAALAMVRLGAGGNTTTQMSKVLHFSEPDGDCSQTSQQATDIQINPEISTCLKAPPPDQDINAYFARLSDELDNPNALYALSLANRLYGEQTYAFEQHFSDLIEAYYRAQLETVDFSSGAEEARININNWVEEQTQGKITDLLPPSSVNSMTKLVLVNAVNLEAEWESPFKEEFPTDAEFRLNKNERKTVKMMRQRSYYKFRNIQEVNCKILELPYTGEDLSMFIILPNGIEDDTTGLEKLEKHMTYDKFEDWSDSDTMKRVEVEVKLPRFKMEQSYDLKNVLISMGMVDAFDISKSDFSGMSQSKDLVLSRMMHKSSVGVTEEGTEAASSIGVNSEDRASEDPENFVADHPFLIVVKHKRTRSVVFAGRVSSPEEA